MTKFVTPMEIFRTSLQFAFIAAEAQAVIAMRLWGMAGLWSVAPSENKRMVAEKIEAAQRGMINAGVAAATGKRPAQVVAAAIKPVRRKTRANSRRLAKRGPKLKGV